MTRCFNGHLADTIGCEGCHHRYHVIEAGKVAGGKIVPPRVNGPDGCDLCHEARHPTQQPGCPRCAAGYAEEVTSAMRASAPLRQEIALLQVQRTLLGWKATAIGIAGTLGGGYAGGLFEGGSGLPMFVFLAVVVPIAQWILKKAIQAKEKKLPRLSPTGEIVFGEWTDDGEDSSLRRE